MPPALSSTARRIELLVSILAVGGVLVSAISLQHHYSTSNSSFCNLSETLNCDVVNRSVYSKIAGVPVALVGIVGYLALFGIALFSRGQREKLLLAASLIGLVFALRLTYIEGWVLGVWCVLCLTSLELIFDIAVLSGILAFMGRRRSNDG
jgi:uncharacterized membrane protein